MAEQAGGSKGPGEITVLLAKIREGSSEAESALIPLVYDELRRLARRHLRRERPNHTLQTTALVHEAYLRLIACEQAGLADRTHFFALSATLMRRILVDHARTRRAEKRGGDIRNVALEQGLQIGSEENWDHILAVHEALTRLAEIDPRQAKVVELRFFAGMEHDEIAQALGVSDRTVKRDWRFAQAWLYSHMFPTPVSSGNRKTRLSK